jgi:hypothetical protein
MTIISSASTILEFIWCPADFGWRYQRIFKEMFNARNSALAAWRADTGDHPARFVVALKCPR